MDNIEEKFYKTFGIKPQKLCFNGDCADKNEIGYDERICDDRCVYIEREYPKITAEKLLKMICVLSQSYPLNYEGLSFYTVQELKETILEDCIKTAKRLSLSSVFANNIQQLFEEET